MGKIKKILLYLAIFIIGYIILWEATCAILINRPALLVYMPKKVVDTVRGLYMDMARNLIQYMPECARYDKDLTYTLKPGKCVFSNVEFRNVFSVNSMGVRDDEKSLTRPQVIVAGDSQSMGWGVNQDETFAQLIEQKTGLTVLNTAISSYGTVREMRMLRRLDVSNLKFLIVQYHKNDAGENETFYLKKNTLPIMSLDEYQKIAKMHAKTKRYFFGKYALNRFRSYIIRRVRGVFGIKKRERLQKKDQVVTGKDEAELFINVIMNSHVDLSNVRIIVFRAIDRGDIDAKDDFIPLLRKRISSGDYPGFIKNITALDILPILSKDDFYVLDDHPKSSGHAKIARALIQAMGMANGK